jgi:hypothetical protein
MFVAAPLGHVLIGILQKIFAGRTSLKAKILQILVQPWRSGRRCSGWGRSRETADVSKCQVR